MMHKTSKTSKYFYLMGAVALKQRTLVLTFFSVLLIIIIISLKWRAGTSQDRKYTKLTLAV